MPGPAPTDPAFKVIAGTFRPDRDARDDEVVSFPVIEANAFPEAPQHLNPDGALMWKTLGPELVHCGVLQTVDLFALEQLCYAWQLFRIKAKAGMDINVAESGALRSLFAEFAMTPAARRRVIKVAQGGQSKNKFAKHNKTRA